MLLTDTDIRKGVEAGLIKITDFDLSRLGSNSYDLRLGDILLVYTEKTLDAKIENPHRLIEIPEEGILLLPGELYLGVTKEYTSTNKYAPYIEGKSSLGRLGMCVHITAGVGDIGFSGHWTLEITVVKPLKIYAGMPVCQIMYLLPMGECAKPYSRKSEAKYQNQGGDPTPSMMWKNFVKQPA